MADLSTIRANAYTHLSRTSSTAMDAVIDLAINSAIELLGRTVSSIYEEEIWDHVIDSDDITNKVDNFALPITTKLIRTATLIDTTTAGGEVFYPLRVVSPDDAYDTQKHEGIYGSGRTGYYTNSEDFTGVVPTLNRWRTGGYHSIGRVNREGKPEIVYRVGTNIYIQPYAASEYENWKIRLLLEMYPDSVSLDADTNTIIDRHPHALLHFALGIIWASHFHDQPRATAEFQLGAQFLQGIATDDQLKKLVNMHTRFMQ